MTEPCVKEQGALAAAQWRKTGFARAWAEGDTYRDLLSFPRQMAAVLIAADNPEPGVIVDVGSGPGDFLAVMLDQFPQARGVWTDVSEAMFDMAQEQLAPYGDRVDFHLVDMTDLAGGGVPEDAGVITTSRAAHHLDRDGLFDFYAQAAGRLAPGGWLVNLDHIGPRDDDWDKLLRVVRKRFQPPAKAARPHHHKQSHQPIPSPSPTQPQLSPE